MYSIIIGCQSFLEYFWKSDLEWEFFQLLLLLTAESEGGKNGLLGLEIIRNH